MRKLLLAVVCLCFITGLAIAAEVTVVKYDKDTKKLTVKDGDAEKTYKITDKTKVSMVGKDGTATEGKMEALEKRLTSDKAVGSKLDITTDKDEVTEVKLKGGKKK